MAKTGLEGGSFPAPKALQYMSDARILESPAGDAGLTERLSKKLDSSYAQYTNGLFPES